MATEKQEFRYSRYLGHLIAIFALVMLLGPLAYPSAKSMRIETSLLLASFSLCLIFTSVCIYRYSLAIDGDDILATAVRHRHFLVSEIVAINIEIGRGHGFAIIKFKDGSKLIVPSSIGGFNNLVELLRAKTKLNRPAWEVQDA
jgi:prepilin signal peptidase PulO-like enzyme (type II secretory pathway)